MQSTDWWHCNAAILTTQILLTLFCSLSSYLFGLLLTQTEHICLFCTLTDLLLWPLCSYDDSHSHSLNFLETQLFQSSEGTKGTHLLICDPRITGLFHLCLTKHLRYKCTDNTVSVCSVPTRRFVSHLAKTALWQREAYMIIMPKSTVIY